MASSSAAVFLPSSSPVCPKKHDVFVSFRGDDTRTSFVCHLNGALMRRNIKTYVDDKLDRGDVISEALMESIADSHASIIIFSENYAFSRWCLDELTEIMECKKFGGQAIIPVFYKIDPSHVRKQLGSYENAFARHERDSKPNKDKLLKWKTALTEAADLAGLVSHNFRTDYELVEEIVKVVMQRLKHIYPSELTDLVGVEQNCSHIESLLNINSSQVQIIGIWGMGGIGKTALSSVLFTKLSSQYEGSCFLENVRMESKKHGLNHLRNKLLSELLEEENLHIPTPQATGSFVLSRLNRKRVFIVLDDVNASEQLEYLVGKHGCLGQGSRVIVTSRDKHVFSKGVDKIYEVKKLNGNDSLQLFCLNAFNKIKPEKQLVDQSTRAIIYAGGIPLALKVLGSFLRSKNKKEWDDALTKLQKIPNREIQDILSLSYDELDYEEKGIFLDIECFLKGWKKNDVRRLLDACNFYPNIGIRKLVDKALVTISMDNTVEMHDLIQEMGWEIVRQESIKNPGKRSRLWDPEDVYYILKYNKGTDAVEGILLDASRFGDLNLTSNVFKNMINLRFLEFHCHRSNRCNLYLPHGLETLPDKLIYFYWREYPLKSLPPTFCAEKLVELSMPYSHVKKLWDGVQNLANLRKIVLSGSRQLLELPDMFRASNLKSVYLRGCTSLCAVHPSILSLPKLESLSLEDCKALKSLRSEVPLESLQYLTVNGCSSLQELLVASQNKQDKRSSYLWAMAIDELSPSILVLGKRDYILTFRVTENPCKLDTIFDSSWPIVELNLSECTLSELPENINQLQNLVTLDLKESHLVRLPENIKHLSMLTYLHLQKCRKLEYLPELPPLLYLDARGCTSLKNVFCSLSEAPTDTGRIETFYSFKNCKRLCQDAVHTMMEDAHIRIIQVANNLLKVEKWNVEEDKDKKDDSSNDGEDYDADMTSFCFPGNKLPNYFSFCSTQPSLTIELSLSSVLLGFAFSAIVSTSESDAYGLSYECSFEADDGETIYFKSWFNDHNCLYETNCEDKLISDHIYLWYDTRFSFQIMDKLLFSGDDNKKFSFKFLLPLVYSTGLISSEVSNEGASNKEEVMVRMWGVQPIYFTGYLTFQDEGSVESYTSMEIDELQNIEFTEDLIFRDEGDIEYNTITEIDQL